MLQELERALCDTCTLFGDLSLAPGEAPVTQVRDGVGIDRFTGGAANGAKFDLQAVSPGARFIAPICVRNFEAWQLGALLLAVNDIADGLIAIGSGRSRGLGAIKGWIAGGQDEAEAGGGLTISYIGLPAPIPAAEVWGLGKFLGNGAYGPGCWLLFGGIYEGRNGGDYRDRLPPLYRPCERLADLCPGPSALETLRPVDKAKRLFLTAYPKAAFAVFPIPVVPIT